MPDASIDRTTLDALRADFRARLASASAERDLKALTDEFIGRKSGSVTGLLKTLGGLAPDARRELGALVNTLKAEIETSLDDKRTALAADRPPAGAVDVTLPARELPAGRIHPLMRLRHEVEDVFTRLGFQILEGAEVEDDIHNFEALNMPADHPARDMQDTLYLETPIVGGTWGGHLSELGARGSGPGTRGSGLEGAQVRAATLLRTHTSAMQIRYMKTFPPPVRIMVPGRVYRRDNLDLTHTPMFQQFEGLVVGEGVTMADLKGTLLTLLEGIFGDVQMRLRPSFFPYTEPSAEVDISCQSCAGRGCAICKQTGWLEILGSGMVHPAVFEAVGYDPERVTGFAFGMGLERPAMLKYGVDDIRLFYENDLRFLEQFPRSMKVLLSWLREFVDVTASADEIAELMGVRGFAVESIERVGATDAVIDFEVTGNRPDCMSVVGMAREVAAAYDVGTGDSGLVAGDSGLGARGSGLDGRQLASPVPNPQPPIPNPQSATPSPEPPAPSIAIAIDNPELCPRYVGAMADVTIAPSPQWLQDRLTAGGVRPISNIVDITNYVLLELGQPMHAFDYALIDGRQIRVRTARPGETLRTLDGEDRALAPEMLVIADATEPIALAGVKGGAKSEITSATRTIVFESAHFNALSVRRTSKKLGLKTDASMRFERGSDPGLPALAMRRALDLLERIGAGTARGPVIDCHPAPVAPRVLVLRQAKLNGLLGTDVPEADVLRILVRLDFKVGEERDGWEVTVPTRRVDVQREVDLIEEVARHYGFDRIPVTFPALTSPPQPSDPRVAQARQLRGVMTGAGFSEAMTFGFIGQDAAAPFATDGDLVPIANPLSENFAVLRPSALPGLIDAVAHNRRRGQRDVRLFEIGNRFSRASGERRSVACVWTGAVGGDHWSGGTRDVDFFDIAGLADRVALSLGIHVQREPRQERWLVPGRGAALVVDGAVIGSVGQLPPALAEQHGIAAADAIYVAEIDLDAADRLRPAAAVRMTPLPRFPSVTRDIAILVGDTLAAEQIRRTVRTAAPATLVSVREFDRYQGKGVPEGKVSLALRLLFRAADRTLTDAEVQGAMDTVLAALKEKHDAVQR